MCGIAGIYRRGDVPIQEARLLAMRQDQAHRGPDAVGLRTAPHIGLAFNRLAIIDLSPAANQPMGTEDGGVWIVFNGEIYNFQDLRGELEARGRRFRTRSDTEVILQGYLEWGLDVLPRLNGMFALALWDAGRSELHLARDRVGKKPLFYRDAGGEVVFASEVRALLKGLESLPPVDDEALDAYLAYQCVPGETSIFRDVRKLPPASVGTFASNGACLRRYWRLSYNVKESGQTGNVVERLEEVLADATRIRMISDVPLGAFLSGGVDSSVVVALMSRHSGPVRTFSIGFGDRGHDELPYARMVASHCGTRHTERIVEPDAAAILPRLVWHYGEPFADSSAVPTYYVSAAAREEVTVALNGDGGDEGFAGYPWHRTIRAAEVYRRRVPGVLRRNLLAPAGRFLRRMPGSSGRVGALSRFLANRGELSAAQSFWIWEGLRPRDRDRLYTRAFRERLGSFDPTDYARRAYGGADGGDDVDRALQVGVETYLPDDLLVKIDIASMANSLEARSPLLDYRVLEFAAGIPAALHLRGFRTKDLLKTLAERLVPRAAVRRPKQGFSIPRADWLRGPLRRPLQVLLEHPRFHKRGYFDPARVHDLIERHARGEDCSALLWSLLWLDLWFRMFVEGDLRRDDSLHDLR